MKKWNTHSTSEQKAQAWELAAAFALRGCTLPRGRRAAYKVAVDPVRVHLLCKVLPSLRRRAQIIRRNAREIK